MSIFSRVMRPLISSLSHPKQSFSLARDVLKEKVKNFAATKITAHNLSPISIARFYARNYKIFVKTGALLGVILFSYDELHQLPTDLEKKYPAILKSRFHTKHIINRILERAGEGAFVGGVLAGTIPFSIPSICSEVRNIVRPRS